MAYDSLKFTSAFNKTRYQMIDDMKAEEASKAVNILNSMAEPIKAQIKDIDMIKTPNLWMLLKDLSEELEKLSTQSTFQSTMLGLGLVSKPVEEKNTRPPELTPVQLPMKEIIEQPFTEPVATDEEVDEGRDRNLFSNSRTTRNAALIKEAEKINKQTEICIPNNPKYKFILKLDTITGVIWVTKNRSTAKDIRISRKVVPVTDAVKTKFVKNRTGYSDKNTNPIFDFTASYIAKMDNEKRYKSWEAYIYETYDILANTNK